MDQQKKGPGLGWEESASRPTGLGTEEPARTGLEDATAGVSRAPGRALVKVEDLERVYLELSAGTFGRTLAVLGLQEGWTPEDLSRQLKSFVEAILQSKDNKVKVYTQKVAKKVFAEWFERLTKISAECSKDLAAAERGFRALLAQERIGVATKVLEGTASTFAFKGTIQWGEWQQLLAYAERHGLGEKDAIETCAKAMSNANWCPPEKPVAETSAPLQQIDLSKQVEELEQKMFARLETMAAQERDRSEQLLREAEAARLRAEPAAPVAPAFFYALDPVQFARPKVQSIQTKSEGRIPAEFQRPSNRKELASVSGVLRNYYAKQPGKLDQETDVTTGTTYQVYKIVWTTVYEERTVVPATLPFPELDLERATLNDPSQVDPWLVLLPPAPMPQATADEAWVIEGSVAPRKCPTCRGRGTDKCSPCNASGRIVCRDCSGNGQVSCGQCQGQGRVRRGQAVIACQGCGGRGLLLCSKCTGQRTVPCSDCEGSGRANCQPCGAYGMIAQVLQVHRRIIREDLRGIATPSLNDAVMRAVVSSGTSPYVRALSYFGADYLEEEFPPLLREELSALHQRSLGGGRRGVAYRSVEVQATSVYRLALTVRGRVYETWLVPPDSLYGSEHQAVTDWIQDAMAEADQATTAGDVPLALKTLAAVPAENHAREVVNKLDQLLRREVASRWDSGDILGARRYVGELRAEATKGLIGAAESELGAKEKLLGSLILKRHGVVYWPAVVVCALLLYLVPSHFLGPAWWVLGLLSVPGWLGVLQFYRSRPHMVPKRVASLVAAGGVIGLALGIGYAGREEPVPHGSRRGESEQPGAGPRVGRDRGRSLKRPRT
jgi:hypothetical protein